MEERSRIVTFEEMKRACADAATEVDDVLKYRDIRPYECATAIRMLADVVRELVRREEARALGEER